MRMVVIAVALLAGLKVWTQDRMVRGVMGDAIVAAYRDRAELSCQKIAERGQQKGSSRFSTSPVVLIGNPDVDVAMWEYDSPLWNVRYRHPHMFLTANSSGQKHCAYDVVSGLARVTQR